MSIRDTTYVKRRCGRQPRPRDPRNHHLRNAHAPLDRHRRLAEIDQQNLDLAAIIGVDRAGRVEHGETVLDRQARARAHLSLAIRRQRDGDAGRHQRPRARRERQRRVGRPGGAQVAPGRVRRLIGGQGQVRPVRQLDDPDLDVAHRFVSMSAAATRSISVVATASFDCGSQLSTPDALTSWIVLVSPPMMPAAGETSLARIQSQPLRASLACALATTFSVSAAKPMTSDGRIVLRCAMVERMSGFSVSASSGVVAPGFFLIFCSPALATRQSATAAAKTAISAGSAVSTALSMSRADSTWITVTPAGSGSVTGPLTRMTSAPAAAAAAAIACTCFPEERLARWRTGSIGW